MRPQHIVVAIAMLAVGFGLAASREAMGAILTLSFLVAAPAIAVAAPLRGVDLLARLVLALAAAAVLNTLVAEVMVAANMWSPAGGVAAVGAISAVIWLASKASPLSSAEPRDRQRDFVAQDRQPARNGAGED
jgi:hypothetical protein